MVMADVSSTVKSIDFGWILYSIYSLSSTQLGHTDVRWPLLSSPFLRVVEPQDFGVVFEQAAVYLHAVQLLT